VLLPGRFCTLQLPELQAAVAVHSRTQLPLAFCSAVPSQGTLLVTSDQVARAAAEVNPIQAKARIHTRAASRSRPFRFVSLIVARLEGRHAGAPRICGKRRQGICALDADPPIGTDRAGPAASANAEGFAGRARHA
jgi:hypothetical protein